MVNVLIDHQKFSTQRYGGISRYFASIVEGIRHSSDVNCQLGVLSTANHYLRNEPLPFPNSVSNLVQRTGKYAYKLNQMYCNRLLAQQNFDLFHPTYYDTYFVEKLRKPLVVTIYDTTYEYMPQYFWAQDPLTYQKRINIERADAIIAISETTKNDLQHFYKADPSKIHVIHLGIDKGVTPHPVDGLPARYLLYVGDRGGYKNFYQFIDAFKQLSARHPDLHVVLAGGGGIAIADRELLVRLGLTDRVKHVSASDEQLVYLYQHAELFVYPSLYEGFGLPVLEAFQAGCPMLLSDIPAFREVAADAAVYYEPTSVEALTQAIDGLLSDTTRKQELVAAGRERLQLFPIENTVQKTLELYKSMV